MSDQLLQTIGQNVGRNSFVGFQELPVAPESPQHHVAQNQQRPAIAQHLHRSIQRTSRPPRPPCRSSSDMSHSYIFHLHFARNMATFPPNGFSSFLLSQ